MKNSEICVPVTALALPGESEGQSTPPAQGDKVDLTATGKVTRIEGKKAYLQLETINGQAVEAETKPENLDDEETALRDQTGKDEKAQIY